MAVVIRLRRMGAKKDPKFRIVVAESKSPRDGRFVAFVSPATNLLGVGADTNGGPGTHQWIARMGEPLYGFQTPNGYSDAAQSWVNTGGLLERMNFGLALANNRVQGTTVSLANTNGAQAKVMDEYLNTLLAGDISAATREALLKQLEPTDPVTKVVGLILGTPEFQRQ